jgi:hypothetical protein
MKPSDPPTLLELQLLSQLFLHLSVPGTVQEKTGGLGLAAIASGLSIAQSLENS